MTNRCGGAELARAANAFHNPRPPGAHSLSVLRANVARYREETDAIPGKRGHIIQAENALERRALARASPCLHWLRDHRRDEACRPMAVDQPVAAAVVLDLGIIDIAGGVDIFLPMDVVFLALSAFMFWERRVHPARAR